MIEKNILKLEFEKLKYLESAPACELSEGSPNLVRKRLKLDSSQDCKEKCDQMNDCLIWQFNKKNTKCELIRLTGKN